MQHLLHETNLTIYNKNFKNSTKTYILFVGAQVEIMASTIFLTTAQKNE